MSQPLPLLFFECVLISNRSIYCNQRLTKTRLSYLFAVTFAVTAVSSTPFICLCLCICLCFCLCICLFIWNFVPNWIVDIMGFQKTYGLRGPWGRTAVLQLIFDLRKTCYGTGGHQGSTRGLVGPKKRFTANIYCACAIHQEYCFPLIILHFKYYLPLTKQNNLLKRYETSNIWNRSNRGHKGFRQSRQ